MMAETMEASRGCCDTYRYFTVCFFWLLLLMIGAARVVKVMRASAHHGCHGP